MRPQLQEMALSLLPSPEESASRPELRHFYQMLRDYPERGGKGLRSELLLLSARAHGLQEGGPGWERALWLAAALELFQNWVLIHDDIVDDSDERRGKPALHKLHGVSLALNAGDALHAYMWAAVHRAGLDAGMDEFLNMIHRTAEGQHLDVSWVEHGEWDLQPQDYLEMVRLKTGYYTIVTPLRLGALAADQTPHPDFGAAGLSLGAAFQIRDDVLNLTGDPAKYGKEIGGDLLEGKRTLVALHWLGAASETRRQTFLEQMRLARTEKDLAVIAELLDWLRESDSLTYAHEVATQEAERGLTLLRGALNTAPDQAAAGELLGLMDTLIRRDA
ncbi:polyprenyl synthetase family protein [Deinococcus radiophilus]|uniref:Polyprenyl synthetase family protein n=1 Tax=Deinococcus radiophilus TaxID=32062 RepID=A0A431VYU9_9DEIO|nr:polyprenyl synthetase family protein [Deinococcus radiophilus]RTR28323.1 polyprenyl synthetase family protein [Deinococcus radiophilus]UFA51187.1 polyprenyl synthetase family protein [Deinococcus radiophilus]